MGQSNEREQRPTAITDKQAHVQNSFKCNCHDKPYDVPLYVNVVDAPMDNVIATEVHLSSSVMSSAALLPMVGRLAGQVGVKLKSIGVDASCPQCKETLSEMTQLNQPPGVDSASDLVVKLYVKSKSAVLNQWVVQFQQNINIRSIRGAGLVGTPRLVVLHVSRSTIQTMGTGVGFKPDLELPVAVRIDFAHAKNACITLQSKLFKTRLDAWVYATIPEQLDDEDDYTQQEEVVSTPVRLDDTECHRFQANLYADKPFSMRTHAQTSNPHRQGCYATRRINDDEN